MPGVGLWPRDTERVYRLLGRRPQMAADVRRAETGLLGLEGFRLAGTVNEDGEVLAAVETTAERAWCEACGERAVSKGRRVYTQGGCGV